MGPKMQSCPPTLFLFTLNLVGFFHVLPNFEQNQRARFFKLDKFGYIFVNIWNTRSRRLESCLLHTYVSWCILVSLWWRDVITTFLELDVVFSHRNQSNNFLLRLFHSRVVGHRELSNSHARIICLCAIGKLRLKCSRACRRVAFSRPTRPSGAHML